MNWLGKTFKIAVAVLLLSGGLFYYFNWHGVLTRYYLDGAHGEVQAAYFTVKNPSRVHVLFLRPAMDELWGGVPVYLRAEIKNPRGRIIFKIEDNIAFGGEGIDFPYVRKRENYGEVFIFSPDIPGEYAFIYSVLTPHVKDIYFKVAEK